MLEEAPIFVGKVVEVLLVVLAQPGSEGEVVGPLHDVDGVDLEAPQGVHCIIDAPLAHTVGEVRDELLLHEPPRSLPRHLHDISSKIPGFITLPGHSSVSAAPK